LSEHNTAKFSNTKLCKVCQETGVKHSRAKIALRENDDKVQENIKKPFLALAILPVDDAPMPLMNW